MAKLAECLVSMQKAPGPILSTVSVRDGGSPCNASTGERTAGGSEAQGHAQLHSELRPALTIKSCFKKCSK